MDRRCQDCGHFAFDVPFYLVKQSDFVTGMHGACIAPDRQKIVHKDDACEGGAVSRVARHGGAKALLSAAAHSKGNAT